MNELQTQTRQQTQTKKKILKSTQKRKQILSTALECFANQGLSKTTLADIAKGSGMGSSHILYHFKNTDEIFYELTTEMFREAQIRSKDYSKKVQGREQKLEAYIHAMFDWLFSNKSYQKLFLQFQSECIYNSQLRILRERIHSAGVEYFYLLTNQKELSFIYQNLLTGSLIDFCLNPIQDVKIRTQTLNFIKEISATN